MKERRNRMSVCIMYILFGGGVFMTPGCVLDEGVVYPDEIVYTGRLPATYSYAPVYRPAYRPRIVYSPTWRGYRGYWSKRPRYDRRRYRKTNRRNRYYINVKPTHKKKVIVRSKNKKRGQKKKHFKKKK